MISALPAPRVPDPALAPPMRWGVLAPGGIARSFVDALGKHTRQRVVAVGSRSAGRAADFAAEFGIDRSYAGYLPLVEDPGVDIVYVASPHSAHYEQTLLAIAAGKHVLVEKAFALDAGQATEMVAAARAAGVFLMEAMWTRFLPGTDVLRQLLADGALGPVHTVLADHGQWFAEDATHRLFDPGLGGGALLDLGVYPVSFASFVLGTPERITAVGRPAFTGVDGQVSAVLESGTAHAVVNSTLFARTPTTASVTGDRARVEFAGPFYAPTSVTLDQGRGGASGAAAPLTHDGGPIVGHEGLAYQAAHVASLVAEGATESSWLPWDETVSVLETMDEIRHQIVASWASGENPLPSRGPR